MRHGKQDDGRDRDAPRKEASASVSPEMISRRIPVSSHTCPQNARPF
jgi:hypothetical protein